MREKMRARERGGGEGGREVLESKSEKQKIHN